MAAISGIDMALYEAAEIDGIPVVRTPDILVSRPLPVIIFKWDAMRVVRNIKRLLPDMPEEDLIVCMADEFPGQANMLEAIHTITVLNSKIEVQQIKINAMRTSISWRLTKPLRTIAHFFSSIFNGIRN